MGPAKLGLPMLYTLSALVVVAAVVVAGRRSDSRRRRRIWIAALGVTGLGLLMLVGALFGPWGLIYVAATMLLVGVPVAVLFTVWVYLDVRDGLPVIRGPRGNGRT